MRIAASEDIEVVDRVIKMHYYWRLNGLIVVLIILNEDRSRYKEFLQRLIMESITSGVGAESLNRHNGGIFLHSLDKLSDEDALLVQKATVVMEAAEANPSRPHSLRSARTGLSTAARIACTPMVANTTTSETPAVTPNTHQLIGSR